MPDLEGPVDWHPLLEGIDIVVHLAAIAHRTHVGRGNYTRANRIATKGLAEACRVHAIKRLIFMSSISAQAGSAADGLVTENGNACPVTAYDRAKLEAEEEIKRSGVPFTILRPVIVYGPGAKANIALILRIAALPIPLPFGAFRNRRSLLSIGNLSEAVLFCLSGSATLNQTFIVSDPEPITIAEIFATLREGMGRSPGLIPIPPQALKAVAIATGHRSLWDRIGRELVVSSDSLQRAGWTPHIETKAGLRAIVESRSGSLE